MTDRNDAQLLDAAWQGFAAQLRSSGAAVAAAPFADNERDLAEGYRYLARLIAYAIQEGFGFDDPAFPFFHRGLDDLAPWGAPNVDNVYLRAAVDGRHVYRVSGNVRDLHGFVINVNEGVFPVFPGFRTSYETSHRELEIAADGGFELILGGERRPGNWIPLGPRDRGFSIREYFYDWSRHRPAELHIERIGGEGEAPPAPTARSVDDTLRRAVHWAETVATYYLGRLRNEMADAQPNSLPPPLKRVPGSAYAHYGVTFFDLAPDEALYIEMPVVPAPYWSFQLYNLWNEFTDPFHRSTSINGHQAHIDADGMFRAVIAHRDPGIANWLDTAGQRRGYLWYRWFWADRVPAPKGEVIALADARKRVAEPAWITPDARKLQLAARRRQLQARFHR